jgi:hypothetical protein
MLIHYGEPPGTFDWGGGPLLRDIERGKRGRQVVKSHLRTLIVWWISDGVDRSQE